MLEGTRANGQNTSIGSGGNQNRRGWQGKETICLRTPSRRRLAFRGTGTSENMEYGPGLHELSLTAGCQMLLWHEKMVQVRVLLEPRMDT